MKKELIIACLLFASACSQAPKSDKAVTTEAKQTTADAGGNSYIIDPAQSTFKWIGTKVSGYHTGIVAIKSGEIKVDGGTITSGHFVMDMKSINVTGPASSDVSKNKKLQGHLMSPDFFEVDKYPEAVFEITSVKPFTGSIAKEENQAGEDEMNQYKVTAPTHMISGNLTIKDITKNIEFPAKININGNSLDAVAKFNIDRTVWNIIYPGSPDDLIRKEVNIGIAIKANRK
jgi:polyisoprenoid-binding protein YceI